MEKFEVEKKGLYQPGWISYISMATGILQSMGYHVDQVDVGGYSGYAFHLNTFRSINCPSAPTVAEFTTFAKGLESFGHRVEQVWDNECLNYPMNEQERQKAKKHFIDLKKIIQETGNPIGIWGAPIPEFAIMNGFDGDHYLVSTYKRLDGNDIEKIKFDELYAPGGLFKFVIRENIDIDERETDMLAIKRALRISKGFSESMPQEHQLYASGIEMFDSLKHLLKEGAVPKSESEQKEYQEKDIPCLRYLGNSYTAYCNQEALHLASSFLKRLSKKYIEYSCHYDLDRASEEYGRAAEYMKEFITLFPFSLEKDFNQDEFPKDKRELAIELLEHAKPHVQLAVMGLQECLKKYQMR